MTEEINYLVCGYCSWTQMITVPDEKQGEFPTKRGYCRFNPPAVFPMPTQQQSKIAALGTAPPVQMQPMMMRPVVEENEPMCGRYSPNKEAMVGLGLKPDEEILCSGTCDKENCCGSE